MKTFQNKSTILLAAQNSDWLADVCLWLKESEYNVLTANGGDQAFCLARRARPDLIVSEIALPEISGIQFCYMTRADKYLSGVLFMLIGESDCQNDDTAAECFRAGANDFFAKNRQRQLLKEKIARLLEFRRYKTELPVRFQNFPRSESQISDKLKDTSNLVSAFDATSNIAAFDDFNIRESIKTFDAKSSPKPQSDILRIWKQTVQSKEIVQTHISGRYNGEKVYFEVVNHKNQPPLME